MESDCLRSLQSLVDEQHAEFVKIYNSGVSHISKMTDVNNTVRNLAHRYFDACQNAEKFI